MAVQKNMLGGFGWVQCLQVCLCVCLFNFYHCKLAKNIQTSPSKIGCLHHMGVLLSQETIVVLVYLGPR